MSTGDIRNETSECVNRVEDLKIINEALDTGNPTLIAHAIAGVAWSRGIGDQAFTGHEDPTIDMMLKMLVDLGFELQARETSSSA